jgi:2-methylisocitrate lyase-like PEP mutase family enzyme
VHARSDPDFVLIARTDARAVLGLEEAIRRGRLYAEAGADVLFIEAPQSEAECRAIGQAFAGGPPLLFNWADGGKSPALPLNSIRELGYRLVIYPISTLLAAAYAMREVAETIAREGTAASYAGRMMSFSEFNTFLGLPGVNQLETEFSAG